MTEQAVSPEQFARLFAESHHRIYRFIRTLVPHGADADDVFQETSVVLWRERERFDEKKDFIPWALAIAFNQVRSHRHRVQRNRLVFDDKVLEKLATEEDRLADDLESRSNALEKCLAKLAPRDAELISAYYEDRTTAGQVAERLGRPVNTIYKALQRIRRGLFDCIERRLAVEAR